MIASLFLIAGVALVGQAVAAPSSEAVAAASHLLSATRFAERRLPPPDVEAVVDQQMVMCMARAVDATKPVDCSKEEKRWRAQAAQLAAGYPQRREALIRAAACIYASHLSITDMESAAAFYESPVGRRLMDAAPMLEAEFTREQRMQVFEILGKPPEPAANPPRGQ